MAITGELKKYVHKNKKRHLQTSYVVAAVLVRAFTAHSATNVNCAGVMDGMVGGKESYEGKGGGGWREKQG